MCFTTLTAFEFEFKFKAALELDLVVLEGWNEDYNMYNVHPLRCLI